MSLWWLEPGWGDACCGSCGTNIQKAGGDPDWGFCPTCFENHLNQQKRQKSPGCACLEYWDSHYPECPAALEKQKEEA